MTVVSSTLSAVCACALVLVCGPADAQTTRDRIEVSFGGQWTGSVDLDSPDGRFTTPNGSDFVLFETRSDLGALAGVDTGVTVRIKRFLRVGALVSVGRSRLTTRVTDDVEGAVNATVSERVTEFAVRGVVVVPLSSGENMRAQPFVAAGVGHLRHLHEGRPLVETGRIYHAGGGADFLLHRTEERAIGLRGEGRVVFRSGGVFLDDGLQSSPAASGSLFFRF